MLKGINSEFNGEEVRIKIIERLPKYAEIIKVSKLQFKDSNKLPYTHFLVQLPPKIRALALTQARYLLDQPVHWDNFRKRDAFQCRKCQRVGHPSIEYELGCRCVKCDKDHGPGECQRKRDDEEKPYCVNCQAFGHVASYRGCPYLKFAQTKINEQRRDGKRRSLAKTSKSSALRIPGISYATASAHSAGVRDTYNRATEATAPTPREHTHPPRSSEEPPLTFSMICDLFREFTNDLCAHLDSRVNDLQSQITRQDEKINAVYKALDSQWR